MTDGQNFFDQSSDMRTNDNITQNQNWSRI